MVKGGDHRTWQNVNALSRLGRVGVLGVCSNDARRSAHHGLPLAFWETASDPALAQPPPKGVRLEGRAWLHDPVGHPSDLFYSESFAAELAARLEAFRPEVVVVEGLWLHGYLEVLRSFGCSIILDCHNVEAELAREVGSAGGADDLESRLVRDVIPARTEAIERSAVDRADQIWVCSEHDADRLRARYRPRAPIVVIPNSVDVRLYADEPGAPPRPASEELTLVYPGFFPYRPNAAAAAFLVDELAPLLHAAGDVPFRLRLIGALPSPALRAAANKDPRLEVTGAVPDVRPFLRSASVMPVPLFQGSGTRLKVLEAFAAGLPVVSTAKGVEGLGVEHRVHALIAESAAAFRDGVLELWRDRALGAELAASARSLVATRFSWDAVQPHIRKAIENLQRNGVAA